MKLRLRLISLCLLVCSPQAAADPEAIRDAILGDGPASGEMDLNQDGAVDVADLVADSQSEVEIPLDDRWAAMELAREYFHSLGSIPVAEKNAAMVSWLLDQPLIKDAGIDTEVVWAYFLDGLPVMYVDNRRTSPNSFPAAPSQSPEAVAPVLEPLLTQTGNLSGPQGVGQEHPEWFDTEIPGSRNALFIDVFESGYSSIGVSAHIQQRLKDVGYQLGSVSTSAEPTMAAFKSQVQNLGLFYITTHAGSGRFEERIVSVPVVGSYFAFQSNIELTKEKFAELLDTDVINKRLVPMAASLAQDANGNSIRTGHKWGITDRFVQHYFSFSKNSLAFIDGCNSANQRMSNALISKGADHLLHWNNSVYEDEAAALEDVLFRRLIGSEQLVDEFEANICDDDDEEAPPKYEVVDDSSAVRPFDIDSVWQELKRLNRLDDCSRTELTFHREEDSDFALLVPAIRSMQVYAADAKLHLYGLFGADAGEEGQVFINDAPMTIQSWSKWEIVIDLPPDAKGEVYVSKNGISGNKVVLSRYTTSASATFVSAVSGLFANASLELDFRGDFSPFRMKPDEEPIYWQSLDIQDLVDPEDPESPKFLTRYVEWPSAYNHISFLEGSSEITYNYFGNLKHGACEETGTITGSGTLPVIPLNPMPTLPPGIPEGLLGQSALNLIENPGVKTWIILMDAPGSTGTYNVANCETWDGNKDDLVGRGLHALGIRTPFIDNGTISGGTFVSDPINPSGFNYTADLQFPDIVPQPPHDPTVYPD